MARQDRELGADDGMEAVAVSAGEKLGDVSLRLGRVDEAIAVWGDCLTWHRGQEDLERVADLHRKIGSGLSHKGERKPAIEHYQKGINLLKDGPPRIELVGCTRRPPGCTCTPATTCSPSTPPRRRCGWPRSSARRAPRAARTGFGRVFGRIGDTDKARQNLERAVELAAAPTTAR